MSNRIFATLLLKCVVSLKIILQPCKAVTLVYGPQNLLEQEGTVYTFRGTTEAVCAPPRGGPGSKPPGSQARGKLFASTLLPWVQSNAIWSHPQKHNIGLLHPFTMLHEGLRGLIASASRQQLLQCRTSWRYAGR